MAKNTEIKPGRDSALVTGKSAANNPNLDRVLQAIADGYKPNRLGKSARQLRIDHTAMIPLEKPIFAVRTHENGSKEIRQLFRAGWYLSPEENYIAEQILNDPENRKLNDEIYAKMEEAGLTVEKEAAELTDAKVVA
jgi:hypothetical protein